MERSRLRTSPEKEEALITSDVLSSILLPAWQKRVTGVRADKKALLRQLVKRGYLLYTEKESIFTHHKKIEKKPKRVMVFDWAKVTGLDGGKQVHLLP
jgi:pyridoxine/pyridoxamine 5'-phosphate oxidase